VSNKEKRSALIAQANTLVNKPGAYTKEDNARVESLLRLADALNVETEPSVEQRSAEERQAFMRYLKTGERRTYTAMSDGVEGAFIVPQQFYSTLLRGIAQYTHLMDSENVNLISSEKGGAIKLPQVDLSTITSAVVTENSDLLPVANPTFSSLSLNGFNYRTNPVAVQLNLEQDSFESVMTILTEAFGVGLARGIGADLVNGAGAGTAPQGILTAAANSGVTSTVSGVWSGIDLAAVYASVNHAYRSSPKCAWLMNDVTYQQILALKDANGRPLLGIREDVEELFGKKVIISPDMPTGPSAKSIVFGDLNQFQVRVVRNGATVLRKSEAPGYVEKYAALYIAFLRVDAALNAPSGAKPVVYATAHV
jgi:HK97 family phage major capsid protein